MAIAYLIELLDSRVRIPPFRPQTAPPTRPPWRRTCWQPGCTRASARLRRLRNLGDRALFIAGFFGDSLSRSVVDIDYYGDVGRAAYANLAESLSRQVTEKTWTGLYLELAQRFHEFADVLAEVVDRTRSGGSEDLLRLYERYLRTGSPRDRNRLAAPRPRASGSSRAPVLAVTPLARISEPVSHCRRRVSTSGLDDPMRNPGWSTPSPPPDAG